LPSGTHSGPLPWTSFLDIYDSHFNSISSYT
jgi:hypothetical protein